MKFCLLKMNCSAETINHLSERVWTLQDSSTCVFVLMNITATRKASTVSTRYLMDVLELALRVRHSSFLESTLRSFMAT